METMKLLSRLGQRTSLAIGVFLLGALTSGLGQTFTLPATTSGTSKLDLGFFNGGASLSLQISSQIDLGNTWTTRADGSLASPITDTNYLYGNIGAANYPVANGGDGHNYFPGGGANYDTASGSYGLAGTTSTDTANPFAIRFGAVVGTFSPTPLRSDWFLVGLSNTVTVPTGGAHLYLAISDAYYFNNNGSYSGLLTAQTKPLALASTSLSIVTLPNGVLLSWPDSATNCVLEAKTNLGQSAWQTVTNTPVRGSGMLSVTLEAAANGSVFRLRATSP
jgi:hypothetical protein